MKIAAIVAEYNPFHLGHQYHIQETRRITGADYVLVVMSGDFVQRGAPAVCNKYLRTRMALSAGADAVIELPSIYSLSSAEYFAGGSVTLLHQLGVVDFLSFGSEIGSISPFLSYADFLQKEAPSYSAELLAQLKKGQSFPLARQKALTTSTLAQSPDYEELTALLSSPNNILGLEYCKALLALGSSIQPVTIQRADSSYHDVELSRSQSPCSSASAIRQEMNRSNPRIQEHVPETVYELLKSTGYLTNPITGNDFSSLLHYKLLAEQEKGFTDYLDCNESISNKICKQLNHFSSLDDFCMTLKSKDITYTRISRILMHILLNLKTPDFFTSALPERTLVVPYARLLGFQKNASNLLSAIKHGSSIPLLSKPADACKLLSKEGLCMLEQDIFCANVYESVAYHKHQKEESASPFSAKDVSTNDISLNDIQCSPIVYNSSL